MLYVLCHEKNYYCGGTTQGKKYLTTHHRIPEEFLHFVNVGMLHINAVICVYMYVCTYHCRDGRYFNG